MAVEQAELWAAVLPVVELLDSIEVPYYIGGSVASAYTGIARATQDADLVAELRPAHAPLLIAALREQYYLSAERIREAIRDQKSFNLIHLATAFKVDVFVSPGTAFDRQTMGRRVSLEVPEVDRALDFCSPEDIVLHKLRWYEMGNRVSERQWYDLQGVLRLRTSLDISYLRRWARELELEDLLQRALAEADVESR